MESRGDYGSSTLTAAEILLKERATEIEAIFVLANTLQCNLDRRTIAVLVELLEKGVHPDALADVVSEVRASSDEFRK